MAVFPAESLIREDGTPNSGTGRNIGLRFGKEKKPFERALGFLGGRSTESEVEAKASRKSEKRRKNFKIQGDKYNYILCNNKLYTDYTNSTKRMPIET